MEEIFISYSTKDNEVAARVYDSLLKEGLTCWFAPNDIPPGGDYASRITQALDKVRFVLVIVSQNSGLSEHVKREVTLASESNKTIIPFRIDSSPLSEWMRYYISTLNWLEANENNMEESILNLIEKIMSMNGLYQYENAKVKSPYGKSQVVKGDKGNAKTKSYIYNIQEQELVRTQAIHIPFSRFETAENLLKEKRILFLQSEKHTGKYTTSIALLRTINVGAYFQVFPNISAEELTHLPFEKNAGYIIDIISPDTLNSMNGFLLKKLSENLQNSNSFLVITTSIGTTVEQGTEYIIRHEPPADVQKLINNHINLLPLTDPQSSQLTHLISDINFWSYLTTDFLPRESEELVRKLFAMLKGNLSTEDFLSSLSQNVDKRVHSWFKAYRTLDQYALILSLSIFNESQFAFISERTKELKKFLIPENHQENDTLPEAPLGTSYLQQLKEINAESYTDFINTNTGKLPDQFVRFKTNEDAKAILLHVWENYPHLKDVILEYIELLITERNKYTNEKIISMLAEISKFDLLTINNKIIQAWANHKDAYYRILSINLLLKMAEYKENLVYIDKLINYWASLRNNPRLQWIAAAIYGTPIGVYLYPNSFVNLGAIYQANERQMRDVVYDSMKYLFEYGKQDHSYLLAVPFMFKTWLEDIHKDPAQKQQMFNLFYSLLLTIDSTSLQVLLSDTEIRQELLPYWISEGLRHWKSRDLAEQTIKNFFRIAHAIPILHEPIKIFTFGLLIKGGTELKQQIRSILVEIIKGPFNNAVVPIVTKIIEIERK